MRCQVKRAPYHNPHYEMCVTKCACETNLFVFGLTPHQHLKYVAHRVSPHRRDGLPRNLASVPLQLVNSGSCGGQTAGETKAASHFDARHMQVKPVERCSHLNEVMFT